jgi:Holliday junction resolvase RusA-like endonuclease
LIEIRMDGRPIGKGRPRFVRATGRTYTPEKTARYEDRLAWAAQGVMGGRPLLDGPLSVTINAHMEIPASKSKRWQAEALGQIRVDDAQIVALHVFKHYTDRPRIEILVTPLA